MEILRVNLLEKKIRAEVIKQYLNALGTSKCVCFTCGNAGMFLKEVGLDVITVGDNELLKPVRWFSLEEIENTFKCFNATSGYLNMVLIDRIAKKMRETIGNLEHEHYFVPTGSGETLLVLTLAYPDKFFFPLREGTPETQFDEGNPLNSFIEAIAIRNHRLMHNDRNS